jgi:hypothetical protein
MNDIDWTGLIFGTLTLVLAATILIVVLIQGNKYVLARAARAGDDRYAALTARYEELAAGVSTTQAGNTETLADIRDRVAEIERMLREVE